MDYEQILTNYIGHPAYLNLPDEDKQPALEVFAQRYVEQNPDQDSNFINKVTENYNKKHLRETGQGRAIPMMDRVQLPHWDEERWANLSQSQKREEIESFQAKIPELVDKYPTMREDAEHFFKQYSQGLVRENETQDQSRVADHFNRALFHGFAGGLLNYMGMPDASESVKNTFLTRPDLDDSWTGAFAQGVGDLGASMTIFLGATLIAGKAGAGASLAAMAGTGASLGTNAVMRYNQAYRNAIEAGLSEDQANESGISAIPAAAIDVVGDRILGLKILPVNSSKVFSVGTSAEKRAAIGQLIKENSTRSKLMGVAQASLSEGITEVASDYYAARAPYLLHEQNKDFLPTGDDLFKSFVIGSVLGGTLAGGAMAGRYTGDKTGTDETKYANKDIRNLAEIDRNFDSIESNREVWDAMAEGQWSKAYDISKKVIEDNLEREKAEAEQREAERTQQLDQFGTTIPGELNINLENEATQPTATYQQKKTAVATFEFAPVINDPVKQQIYTDLFESNLDATGTLESNQVARRERTMRLNQVAPDRVRFQSELTTSIKPTGINQNQVPSVMAYTDTLAAKWLSQDPTRDINQFYEKLNIKPQESMRGFNAVIDRYKQEGKAVVGVTPKSNFASLMGDMLTSFRKADLLQDILTPGELQQIKDSLGVTELDDNTDKELSTQFINWLDNTYTGPAMTGAFAKIKEWVADIYKSVQMWLPRNAGMDSVFESLFQVTLSPGEFNRTVGQQFLVTPEQTTQQGTLRDIQNQQAPVTPPTKTQADQVVASQEQSVAKTRSQRARDKFAKATGVTQQETTTPLEVGDVIPEVKQSPKTFLKGKKWALQVLADLENNAPDTQVVVGNYSFEGKYHNGVIYLDKTSIVEDAELERVFKHEAAHALTVGYLNNLTQNLQGEALVKKLKDLQKDTNVSPEARALIKAYFHAGKKLNIKVAQRFNPDKKEGLTRNDYAFINLDEFIAEALSNSDFQEQLSSIKYNGKSVFDHILDLIKSLASWAEGYTTAELFGKYDGQNVLAEVMLAAHQMMGEQAGPFTPPFSPRFSPKLESLRLIKNLDLVEKQETQSRRDFLFKLISTTIGSTGVVGCLEKDSPKAQISKTEEKIRNAIRERFVISDEGLSLIDEASSIEATPAQVSLSGSIKEYLTASKDQYEALLKSATNGRVETNIYKDKANNEFYSFNVEEAYNHFTKQIEFIIDNNDKINEEISNVASIVSSITGVDIGEFNFTPPRNFLLSNGWRVQNEKFLNASVVKGENNINIHPDTIAGLASEDLNIKLSSIATLSNELSHIAQNQNGVEFIKESYPIPVGIDSIYTEWLESAYFTGNKEAILNDERLSSIWKSEMESFAVSWLTAKSYLKKNNQDIQQSTDLIIDEYITGPSNKIIDSLEKKAVLKTLTEEQLENATAQIEHALYRESPESIILFSPKDLLKATDDKNPASVMQKFVDVFQSKIKQADRTLDDANKIADRFLLDVEANMEGKLGGFDREFYLGSFVTNAVRSLLTKNTITENTRGATWATIENAFLESNNHKEFSNILLSKIDGLKESNMQEIYFHEGDYLYAKYRVANSSISYVKAPTKNTLSLDTYLNVTYVNQEGNRVRELYDPSNPIHALHASDLTKAIYSMSDSQRADRLNDLAKEVAKKRHGAIHGLIRYLGGNNDYTPIEKAIVLAGALKYSYTTNGDKVNLVEMTESNELLPAITGGNSAALAQAIKEESSLKKAFKKAVENNIKFQQEQNSSKDGWIRHEQSDSMKDAIALMDDCAGTPWCTGRAETTAHDQLKLGNFDTLFVDGKPQVAIRTHNGKIEEVRGTMPDQSLTPEQEQWAKQRIETADYTGGEEFLSDMQLKQDLIDIIQSKDVEKLLILAIKDGISINNLRPKKRFRGAIGYRNTGEFEESVYNALELIKNDAASKPYESDLVYYTPGDHKGTHPEKINKKYILIGNGQYPDGMELNGEYVDAYIGRRAKKENESRTNWPLNPIGTVKITATNLRLASSEVNYEINADNVTYLNLMRGNTGFINAKKIYNHVNLNLGELKVKAESITAGSIEGGDIEVNLLNVKKDIINSNITMVGDVKTITFTENQTVKIEKATIKSGEGIDSFDIDASNSAKLYIKSSVIDPIGTIQAGKINITETKLEGDVIDAVEIEVEKDASIDFKEVETSKITCNSKKLNIVAKKKYSQYGAPRLLNVSQSNIGILTTDALYVEFQESQIDELRLASKVSEVVVSISPRSKIKKIIFDGHVTLRDEDNDIISTQRAIDLGLVESVDSKQSDRYDVDETPDANGGFLSPKIKTESAIRRERLAQIVETLPDTSILTELDIPTFMSLAGDSPTSPRIDREAKLNIKFGDVPSLNLSDNQVTSSENAIIAQQMQENGYDRVPVIINSDIVWADQRDPASENYIEEWPEFIIKQDGEQVVNPFNRNQLNFEQYYPKVSEQDIEAFHKAYQEADETTARELLNKVAEARGFDTTLYYRADVEPVTEVNRPLYLVPSQDVAMTMAEFYAKTRDRDLDSFVYPYYVKRDLNIAQEGDTIKGRILSTSSYMFGEHHSRGSQNFTAYDLKVNGFDGAAGLIDGTSAQELVILNPADAKSAATFTFKNGSLIPLNERFSDAADVRYSPKAAFFKDNAAALQKFKQIRKGKLHDQRDNSTRGIKQAMRKIKDSDLMKLTEAELSSFFNIVNNVYNSRMKGIKNPMSRADSDKVIEKLNLFNEMLNDIAIEEMINDFSGILDFSSLDLDTITREELQAFINAATQEEQAIAAANKNDASKKAHKKREDRYRAKYTANISEMNSRYENAQDYVQQMEQTHDAPIVDEKIRLAVMLHFDHLMQVDPELLTGNDLYNHFFALNNLLDGNITYVPETTIKAIAASKDTMENLSTYISTFRDPYWKKYKFLEAVDRLNEKAELKQVRLGRITATEKTRDFLLNDLFGGLTEGILANAASRKKLKMDQYRNLILSLKKTAGRYMNAEDRFLIASFSRLIQHRYDEAGDSALARNIAKELESIQNVIDKKEREGSHFESTFAPLFRKAIEGIEGEGSFDLLMKELPQRLSGSENIKIGQARADFIQGMIDIFSDFSLESKIISEGFHGVPFTAYANYSPAPVQLNKFESRDSQSDIDKVLTDVLENMEHHHNKEGLKTKSGHFFEREKRLGPDRHYSYNPDFVVDRQLDMFTVDAATIFERFLIAERLKKGSALSEVIAVEEDGSYHADRVNHLLNIAVEYVSHATSRSEPKNLLVNILRKFVNAYSRVTLSSIHHIVSQPLAGMMDYAVRNGDINGWFKAASYYAGNRAKVEEWLDKNVASLGQRGALEAMALDYKRLPQPELNIKSDAVMRKVEEIYEGAGDVINVFIREGDKFGSRAVVLAHYLRILQKKNPNIKSLNDVDWDNADRKAFVQAIQMGEKNINASNKINRGEFFTDRNPSYSVLRNVFMAFAAHPASLATQMNMAWRDLIDLKSEGAPKEELTSKLRTIAAISTQAISFAISRFYIGSLVTKAMVSMLQDIFDDEEGKLAELEENVRLARLEGDHTLVAAAQEELNLAKNARSVLLKMENQYKAGQGGLKQSVIRDMLGSLYFGLNSPTVLRMEPITTFYDKVGEKWHKEAREERIADYELEISKASEDERYHDVARLKEELYNFQQYQNIPIMFENIGGVEIGGSYGGALSIAQKATADMIDASLGLKEWNWNDWVIYGAVTGIGQSELRKILTNVDRIENANYQTMQDSEGKMEAAELKQKEKEEREYERFMQRMLR